MKDLSKDFYEIRDAPDKGKGLFATRDIKKNEYLFHLDLNQLPGYTLEELAQDPKLNEMGDHSDYQGKGKYVIDLSPPSYINHSCSPNLVCRMQTIAIKDIFAEKDIKNGEELTADYTLTSVDQFDGMDFWVLDCKCGSKNCRDKVTGDFFTLPIELQLKYYQNLPFSTLKEHEEKFKQIGINIK